jgi:epoxyqueuosine reductase
VIAVNHPASKPEMDWWYGEKNPPGNKLLIQIAKKLADYVRRTYPQINVYLKPYHVEKGGVYLKDAAVVAGLGCIGKNNLLVTPKFGPQVRLRAIGLSANLPSTGAIDYDPCISCQAPCIKACPQNAFDHKLYSEKSNNVHFLPARDGNYSRKQCAMEMELNESAGEQHLGDEATLIKYCRKCEFSCLAGK